MAKWDIAREAFDCRKCHGTVGQGEAYRVSNKIPAAGFCEECSIAIDGEHAPAYIDERPFIDRIRHDIAQAPPRRELASTKSGPQSVRHGRQASFDPRVRRSRGRHGVVERIRETTETDWAKRAAGDRDE